MMSSGENPKCLDINTLLYNLWVKEEITREIRSHFKLNVNKSTGNQNVDVSSAWFREKCITLNAYIRRKENK